MNKQIKKLSFLALSALALLPIGSTPTQAAKQTTNWRVIVRIDEIHCIETEDLLGSDEFYTLSGFTFGLPDGRQLIRTRTTGVMSINNGNRKKGTTILDVTVPHGTTLSGELMGLDEDVSKDWTKVDAKFTKAGEAVGEGIKELGGKKGGAIKELLNGAIGVIGGISTLDQDDVLGQYGFPDLTIQTQRNFSDSFSLKNSAYFGSDWSYRVKYSIKVTPTSNQPNL
ncbi:hypothetical protein [Armatimonas sp.]|uniref:hypothetical protein n=1 Tax=Armatimonas sp. TaxID=1872638 RepID=UPI00286C4750|nr:hypothetical protein [Armatimonas sp.]